MLAVILATELDDALAQNERTPAYLLRLGDRPFLQHVVEALALRGITRFEFVFPDSSAAPAAYFGDGSRWGCKFNFYTLSKAGLKPLLRAIVADWDGGILLGRADQFPAFGSQELKAFSNFDKTAIFTGKGDHVQKQNVWAGWAVFPTRHALSCFLAVNMDTSPLVPSVDLNYGEEAERVFIYHQFSARSGKKFLRCQQDLFSGQFPDLQIGGRQVGQGVWMGRNVSLHPSAKVVGPVYIGANSRIGPNSQVGPCSVIAEDCIIGADSIVCNSLINPGSYVGESLEIHQSIVDHEQVMDVKSGAYFRMTDQFLLGSLVAHKPTSLLRQGADRVVAAILLVAFSPLIALALLFRGGNPGSVVRDEAIRLPNEKERHRWSSFPLYRFHSPLANKPGLVSHFFSIFLPGLLSVVKGDLSLVGVKPRSAHEVDIMPEDWRTLYLKTKAGLVTDAVVNFDLHLTEDELRASECYYSATESFSQDLRLMGLYVRKLAKAPAEEESSVRMSGVSAGESNVQPEYRRL